MYVPVATNCCVVPFAMLPDVVDAVLAKVTAIETRVGAVTCSVAEFDAMLDSLA